VGNSICKPPPGVARVPDGASSRTRGEGSPPASALVSVFASLNAPLYLQLKGSIYVKEQKKNRKKPPAQGERKPPGGRLAIVL